MMTSRFRQTLGTMILLVMIFALFPSVASAACCRCTSPSNVKNNICINTPETDCTAMPGKSVNLQVKALNCTQSLADPQCKSVANGGVCTGDPQEEFLYSAQAAALSDQKVTPIEPPTLGIPIPGLNFSTEVVEQGGYIEVPFFAQYVVAAYQYLIGASAIAAAIMIVYGGFLYIVAASGAKVKQGKTIIVDAVIGLVLVLGAYVILGTLNPELTVLKALRIKVVKEAPDAGWLAENGTADPVYSAEAFERSDKDNIPGTPGQSEKILTPAEQAATQPVPSQPVPSQPGEPAVPPAPIPVTKVDIRDIPFDKSLGGPENINKYCTPKSEAQKATTYEQKIQLLVKAVLGWHKVCVQNKLCVYCQACSTQIPNGAITGSAAPNYAVTQFVDRSIFDGQPEILWINQPKCVDAWYKRGEFEKTGGKFAVNAMPECALPAQELYKQKFIGAFIENKLWGGDCGSFTSAVYSCAGAARKSSPQAKVYNPVTKSTVSTAYLSDKNLDEFDNLPGMIISAHMDENLDALAAKKGGFKFGDLIYICCGGKTGTYSSHWLMYTGGRPDVPFSIIEMGGGQGAVVPGLGQISGVHTQPPGKTVQDYINSKTIGQPYKTRSGKVLWTTPPAYDPHKGLIFVWRPYAE